MTAARIAAITVGILWAVSAAATFVFLVACRWADDGAGEE